MADETLTQVLEEVRMVMGELSALREDVKVALTHGGDINKLKADVVRIDAHLKKIDAFMAGPPALQERLQALERKQEKDRKTAARETSDAGEEQERVNVGFRLDISRIFDRLKNIESLTLTQQVALSLVLAVVIFIGYQVLAG